MSPQKLDCGLDVGHFPYVCRPFDTLEQFSRRYGLFLGFLEVTHYPLRDGGIFIHSQLAKGGFCVGDQISTDLDRGFDRLETNLRSEITPQTTLGIVDDF